MADFGCIFGFFRNPNGSMILRKPVKKETKDTETTKLSLKQESTKKVQITKLTKLNKKICNKINYLTKSIKS
jgi:hypothetical protein